jgi:hypothetical protein
MMINLRKSVALLCAVLVSGCAGAPPLKRFAGDRQETPIHELSVAIVTPRYMNVAFNDKSLKELVKTQNGMASGGAAVPSGLRLFLQSVYDPEKLYRSMTGVYYQNFKKVTIVDSVSDPRVAQADMIAIPEVTFSITPPPLGAVIAACEFTLFLACLLPWTTKTVLLVTTAFYTPDHSLLATIKSAPIQNNRHKMPLADPKLDEYIFPNSVVGVANSLDHVFQESPELKQYANGLKSKAGAQASAAPAENRGAKLIESDVDSAAYHFSENPLNYAVVVGVESYANLPAAAFAKRDAEAMRAHLRALGYPGQNIAMLTDSQATGSKLKSYIESWLPRNVKPDSKVFVYFAGHGAPDTESKQAYLLLWDGDAQYISDTGYPVKRLYEKLNELKVKEVVLAMDSSFSGAGGRSVLAKGARPLMGKMDAGGSANFGKVTVLTAAAGDEITGDAKSEGHGLFTYYLLKSLNERSGADTVSAAYARFSPLVQDAARKASRSQTPQLLGENAAQATLR